jgi:hypothetical protein
VHYRYIKFEVMRAVMHLNIFKNDKMLLKHVYNNFATRCINQLVYAAIIVEAIVNAFKHAYFTLIVL